MNTSIQMKSAPNFLEEEDYETEEMPSTAPNFLEEEDYEAPVETLPVTPTEAIPTNREWREAAAEGEVKPYEHPNKGKNPNSPTKKKRKPGTKYHRRDITEKDILVLAFIEKFKLVTTKQTAIILGITRSGASKRLNGLKEIGLVDNERTPGMPGLWFIKKKGKAMLDAGNYRDSRVVNTFHKAGTIKFSTLNHGLYSAQIAAQLCAGMEVLPESSKVRVLPKGVKLLNNIVDETFIRSSWGSATFNKHTMGKDIADRGMKVYREAKEKVESGELTYSNFLQEYPALWTIVTPLARRKEAKEFHYPDMVIDFEWFRRGNLPTSIAVEIELSPKKSSELKKILTTFKLNFESDLPIYRKVIYLVQSEAIANSIEKMVEEVGIQPGRVEVVFIKDYQGELFNGRAWDL